jgi:phage terminase large subunit-like protein
MLGNVVTKENHREQVYPRKDRNENKIDGPVAHMMVLGRWMTMDEGSSVYAERGALVL